MTKLILASASPRRLDLLKQIGVVPDQVIAADINEDRKKDEPISAYVQRLSCEKAAKIAETHSDSFVIGADTAVAVGTRLLGKPDDEAMAWKYLELMSGRRHRVYTGVCVIAPGGKRAMRTVQTVVQFKRLSKAEIENYISGGDWEGKAGAYAIQGAAEAFITFMRGSYSNVIGLPLYETSQMLTGLGYKITG